MDCSSIPAAAYVLLVVAFLLGIATGAAGHKLLSYDARLEKVKRGWKNPRVNGKFVKVARFDAPKFPCG
jgi:hypothetical protein